MRFEDIHRVLVIGAGTMGLEIGFQAASHGLAVAVQDVSAEAREVAPRRLRAYGEKQVRAGALDPAALEEALAAITVVDDAGAAAAEVDLVHECVVEDPALKGEVLGRLHSLCPARTVFATNTSMLLPSMFAEATGRPDRFAAMHFHIPVWSANVADVMPHPGTSPETMDLLLDYARGIGQIPIRLQRESVGYVFNAVYSALSSASMALVAKGVASFQDVDRAWMRIMRMPVGPFGMLDDVGLDTVWHITSYWAERLGDPVTAGNAALLGNLVDAGRLGTKSGAGFYEYPDPEYQQPGFVEGE